LDIDTVAGRVFFQQDWHYTWLVFSAAVSPWTQPERRGFHHTLDRQIWGVWSNRVRLGVAGATDFCRRFSAAGVPINFDIHWVTGAGQWEVTVRKMPAGSTRTTFRSNVDFARRKIELDTMDLVPSGAGNAAGGSTARFLSGPHEFGHTLRAGDEYGAGSADIADTNSVMNVGRQVRPRHLQLIVTTLSTMMPGVTFSQPGAIP
jgi:hypothetical protein